MNNYLADFLVATGVGLGFLALGWGTTRTIFLGKPLPVHMRIALVYGFFFILGMAYIMMGVSWLNRTSHLIYPLIAAWGVLLAYLARRRYKRTK